MIRDPRGGHNRKRVNEDFFKTWTPSMSYVLGFMFADGSLLDTNSSSRTYYLSFANNDLDLLTKIRSCLSSSHRIYVKPSRLMIHKNVKYTSREGYVLRIGNKVMYQDLVELGLTHRKSRVMHLPNIPNEFFAYFLRGYFDGDGCINLYMPKGRSTYRLSYLLTSGSADFLEEIAIKIGRILHIEAPSHYQSRGAYNLTCHGKIAVQILSYMYSNLESAPFMKRKYEKFYLYLTELMGVRVKKALTH